MIRRRRKTVEVGAGEEGKEETRGQEGKGTRSTCAQDSEWGARAGRRSFQVHPLLLLCLSGCPPFASPSSSGSLLGWRVRIKAGVALGQDVASALSRRRFLSNAFSRGCLTCGSIAVVSRVVYRLVALLRTRWSAAAVRGGSGARVHRWELPVLCRASSFDTRFGGVALFWMRERRGRVVVPSAFTHL